MLKENERKEFVNVLNLWFNFVSNLFRKDTNYDLITLNDETKELFMIMKIDDRTYKVTIQEVA